MQELKQLKPDLFAYVISVYKRIYKINYLNFKSLRKIPIFEAQ